MAPKRYILTDMTIRSIDQRPNVIAEIEENVPMRKLGDRRDLKGAVVLLLSEASAYTTGTDLCIDGGLVAH
jgi:sorbose reductase